MTTPDFLNAIHKDLTGMREIVIHLRAMVQPERPVRVWGDLNQGRGRTDDLPPLLADVIQLKQVALKVVRSGFDACAECPRPQRMVTITIRSRPSQERELWGWDAGTGMSPANKERRFQGAFIAKTGGMAPVTAGAAPSSTPMAARSGPPTTRRPTVSSSAPCYPLKPEILYQSITSQRQMIGVLSDMLRPSAFASGPPDQRPTTAPRDTSQRQADCDQVVVVDDDPSILTGLAHLLATHGYRVRLHQDPVEFLETGPPVGPACLLLDNQLEASMTGVQVHAEVVRRGWNLPTIFLTGLWSLQSVVTAMRAGADSYLAKPYEAGELLKAIEDALLRAWKFHHQIQQKAAVLARASTLTKRERQIIYLVLDGKMNKEIADEVDLALVTVKVHRGRAMSKLGVTNTAELAHLAWVAGLCSLAES